VTSGQSDPRTEYRAVRGGVGLVDRRDLGVVEVSGRDRASFLNALLSNDIKALAAGQGCEATLLDIHGKVQALLTVWVLDDRILLVTPPGLAADTVERLDHYLFSEKVSLADVTAEWALFMLAGPGAPEVAERVTHARPPAARWSNVAATLDGTAVRLVTGGGETGGAEVWVGVPASAGAQVYEALTAAGASPVGAEALESLRVEAGALRFGPDIGPTVLLSEVPSEHLLSHGKGCYPGQEVVVRIRDRGHVNRHLRGLVLAGTAVPQRGDEVVAGDSVIGAVTSATHSFALEHPIALALIRREHAEPGTSVGIRVAGSLVPATVSALPFAR
jgi:folate-binding protein YgfZ